MTRSQILQLPDIELKEYIQAYLDSKGIDKKVYTLYGKSAMEMLSKGKNDKIYFVSSTSGLGNDSVCNIEIEPFLTFLHDHRGGITARKLGIV